MADAAIMGVEKLERARWAGMVASSWVQAALGVLYCFGLYAPMLKQVLGYNQAQLNILGFAKDFGAYVGIVAGLAINTIPVWGFLAVGSMQSLVGYGVLWLVLSGRIAPPPYWLVRRITCACSVSFCIWDLQPHPPTHIIITSLILVLPAILVSLQGSCCSFILGYLQWWD